MAPHPVSPLAITIDLIFEINTEICLFLGRPVELNHLMLNKSQQGIYGFQWWWYCQFQGHVQQMHLFVCERIYICGTVVEAALSWQIDSGEDSALSSSCVLGALELSDTSNAPLVRERGEKRLQRDEEPLMSIVGLDSGEERDGGRGERWGEGKECGRDWGGVREKQEGRREREGGVRLDLYLIIQSHWLEEKGDGLIKRACIRTKCKRQTVCFGAICLGYCRKKDLYYIYDEGKRRVRTLSVWDEIWQNMIRKGLHWSSENVFSCFSLQACYTHVEGSRNCFDLGNYWGVSFTTSDMTHCMHFEGRFSPVKYWSRYFPYILSSAIG